MIFQNKIEDVLPILDLSSVGVEGLRRRNTSVKTGLPDGAVIARLFSVIEVNSNVLAKSSVIVI